MRHLTSHLKLFMFLLGKKIILNWMGTSKTPQTKMESMVQHYTCISVFFYIFYYYFSTVLQILHFTVFFQFFFISINFNNISCSIKRNNLSFALFCFWNYFFLVEIIFQLFKAQLKMLKIYVCGCPILPKNILKKGNVFFLNEMFISFVSIWLFSSRSCENKIIMLCF